MIKFKLMKQEDNQQLVSARELWIQLEVRRDFTNWIKGRIEKYRFVENVDYFSIWNDAKTGVVVDYNGKQQSMVKLGYNKDYMITLDMAKELAMIENNEKGRAVRKYFIQCEKKLRNSEIKQVIILKNKVQELETTVKDYKQKELKRIGTINASDVRWSTCQTVEMLQQKLDEDMKLLQKVFERFSYNKAEMSLYIKQLKNFV
ncbi:MAG: antA/AntB antirepressor family protein [Fusobacterium necrophorum]|nr:antA/AntB antirepressor family protein [Fusobacterium necrophorum]